MIPEPEILLKALPAKLEAQCARRIVEHVDRGNREGFWAMAFRQVTRNLDRARY